METDLSSKNRQPIVAHLNDLRLAILRSAAAIFFASIAGYFVSSPLIKYLTGPMRAEVNALHFFSPTDAFVVKLQVAVLFGLLVASPIVMIQIWNYVAPGLYKKERFLLLPWVISSIVLFLAGGVFAFKAVLPLALNFLMGYQTEYLQPMISITNYMAFTGSMVLAFGIAFNLPIFLMGVVAMGLVKVETLRTYRKHAYVAVFLLAMVLTPPDVMSQMLLALPMLVLFEISLIGAGLISSKKSKEEK